MDATMPRTSRAVISPPPEHLMTSQHFYESLLDRVKTGTALLFSGVFLVLVGVVFTAFGWRRDWISSALEWPQMLGPVLIAVGGTFVLTSVCRFGMVSCWSCRQWDRDVLEGLEETTGGPAVSGQQIMVQHGPVVCFPPSYSFIVPQDAQTSEFGSRGSTHVPPPAYYSLDNLTFTAEEDGTGVRRTRAEKTEQERRCDGTGERLPAYEDIYPTCAAHTQHTLD